MGKLRVLSGREVGAILEANGFVFVRQRGSHKIYRHEGGVSVPVPDHRELAKGTLSDIIRQSLLPRELFETP
jgi:predicted RNA binding protein YcfA (HicA-like mRNA interferase family)